MARNRTIVVNDIFLKLGNFSLAPDHGSSQRRAEYMWIYLWHDGWRSFLFVWVSVGESLCLFWHETHRKDQRARFPARPEVEEGRKVPEKIERANWQRMAEENSQQQGAEETGRQNRAVKRWVSIPSGFVEVSRKIHASDSHQMLGELHKSVTNYLLLRFELTQVRVCSFVLFFHPLGCVLRICEEIWNTPGRKWEKPLDDLIYWPLVV